MGQELKNRGTNKSIFFCGENALSQGFNVGCWLVESLMIDPTSNIWIMLDLFRVIGFMVDVDSLQTNEGI